MLNFRDVVPTHSYQGEKFKTMTTNKKHLREDFHHRCAYCNDADRYFGKDSFHVDHFAPKSKFPELKITYENLIYSCPYCNRSKSDTWVGKDAKESIVNDRGFENPTSDSYDAHFTRGVHGEIIPVDPLGQYMWENLNLMLLRHSCLYRMEAMERRITQLEVLAEECNIKTIKAAAEDLCRSLSWRFRKYYSLACDENESC